MVWAGTTIHGWVPERGRRVPIFWLDNDESFYWSYEDLYGWD